MQQFQRFYWDTVPIRKSVNRNKFIYGFHMIGKTDMHLLVTDTLTSQYLWPPFASCSASHILSIELIWLLFVACGMLSHSSSMAVQSCWIWAGTRTHGRTCQSRASQTCSMGDISGENAGHGRTGTFLASGKELCTDPCDIGVCIIMLKHEVMEADEWHDNGPQDLVTLSNVHSNCHR